MIDKLLNDKQIKDLQSLLRSAQKVVLCCHVRPDGDAIGSTLGWLHMLTAMGKSVRVVTPDQPPRSLSFLPGYADIVPYSRYGDFARELFAGADLVICCDFNTPSRLSELEPLFSTCKARKVLIDHHERPQHFCDLQFSWPDMSSTCELVFRIMAALGWYDELNLDAATCLTTGIITDTRNLSVNVQHLDLYEIMVALLRKGVNKRLILREALETKSEDAVKLTSFALYERLKVIAKHHAAIVYLKKEDLARFNYEKGDTEGLVNMALELRGVVYSAFLREDDKSIRLSMRSIGNFPVSRICSEHFGGGGHLQAAGGDFHGTIEEAIAKLESVMPEYDAELREAVAQLRNQGYIF